MDLLNVYNFPSLCLVLSVNVSAFPLWFHEYIYFLKHRLILYSFCYELQELGKANLPVNIQMD